MGALTAGQETNYRTVPYAVKSYIYVTTPLAPFQARVNDEKAQGDYPITSFAFDTVTAGAYTDIESGMTLTVGSSPGAYDKGIVRVISATSTTITIPRTSIGSGVGEITINNNDYITVWKDFRLWSKIPYITSAGVIYKDGSTAFSASTAQPPVANCGPDRLFIVSSSTATQEVDFNGTGSFAVASGASISTYLWDVDGGTITTGTTGSSSITVDFTNTGERYVSLTVTDTAGNSHTARCLIVLAEESDCVEAVVGNETIKPSGTTWNFEVFGDDLPVDMLPGARVLYAQTEKWGTSSGAIVGNETRFSGWMTSVEASLSIVDNRLVHSTSIECVDAAGQLRLLPAFSLALDRKVTPTSWYEMANADPDRMIHHILYWHSTALEVCDYTQSGEGSDYPFPGFEVDAGTLFGQADYIANAIAFRFTCNTSGQLKVVGDPLVLPTAAQTSAYFLPTTRTTTVRTTLDEDDYTELSFEGRLFPENHWVWAEGVTASAGTSIAPVFCVAPGLTPGQGTGSQMYTKQIVKNNFELQIRAGHYLTAKANPEIRNVRMRLVHPGWIWEPAALEWVAVTLSSTYQAQDRTTFSSQKMLIEEVRNTYNYETLTKDTNLTLSVEFQGQLATSYTKPEPQQLSDLVIDPIEFPTFDFNFDNFVIPDYTEPVLGDAIGVDIPAGTGTLAGIFWCNLAGTVTAWHAITTNLTNVSPTWTATNITASITTTPIDVITDPNITDDMIVLDYLSVFRVADANTSSFTISQLLDFTINGYAGVVRRIEWSKADPLWLMVVSSYSAAETGGSAEVHIDYTTDGGSTWNNVNMTTVYSGSVYGSSDSNRELGLIMSHVNAGQAWAWMIENTASGAAEVCGLWMTEDYGATWEDDTFFGNVKTYRNLGTVIPGSRMSVYPYSYQRLEIPILWFERAVLAFAGVSSIHQWNGATSSYETPQYLSTTETERIDRKRRSMAVSWTNASKGVKFGNGNVYMSERLPFEWQTVTSMSAFFGSSTINGVYLSSDATTIWLFGRQGIAVSYDFGVTWQSKWGNLSAALTPGTTNEQCVGLIAG